MAVRHATRRYADMGEFLREWDSTLRLGALALRRADLEDEPAADLKLDLVLPVVGRVGPLQTQVVSRGPDGTVGLRIATVPAEAKARVDGLLALVAQVRDHLVASGELVPREQVVSLVAQETRRRAEAEEQTARLVARGESAAAASGASRPSAERPRGLQVPDLSEEEPLVDGPLGDRTLRDAIVEVAVRKISGVLVVVTREGPRHFGFWHKGGPVGWRSEPLDPETVLGVLLFRAGRITRDQLEESLRIMEEEGIRQGEALIQMGALNFPQLVVVLQKQAEVVLQKVMRLRDGYWAFYGVEDLPERFVNPPLRVPSILFRALVQHAKDLSMDAMATAHRPNLDRYVFLAEDVEQVLGEIQFQPQERKFLDIVRSNAWRLREIFARSNLSRTETASVVYAFNEMGFFEYRGEETRERYLQRVGARIRQKARQVKAASHFDVLEIHWICVQEEVEEGYTRARREFDTTSFRDLPEDLAGHLAVIQESIERSYRYLQDEKRRRAYREEVVEKAKIEGSAEILGKKGEMALLKADRREAVICFSKALELVPHSSAYREGLMRARSL